MCKGLQCPGRRALPLLARRHTHEHQTHVSNHKSLQTHAFQCPQANYHSYARVIICRSRRWHSRQEPLRPQVDATISPSRSILFAFCSANADSFNSLFKVLFIFPSWYLFAISLNNIFSFTWNLPPTLHSNAEECDSSNIYRARRTANDKKESHPHWRFLSIGLHLRLHWQYISKLQFKAEGPNFQAEQFLVHSQLLKESHLVHFPPPTYMLKFSRFTCFTSC